MSRIVSVWLPRWPILRALAAQANKPAETPIAPERPFVLAIAASGGPRIAALNEAAEALGLAIGEPLADARAKAGFLQVRAVDTAADDAALRRLTLWATRYTPTASPWGEENGADGFFLDIEGAAHLFGGEERLIADLAARLEKNGLPGRLAIADTPGAAWAASHFHAFILPREAREDEKNYACAILPSGQEAEALSPLPIEALRLSAATRMTLRRLGLKTVGALLDKPRAPLAARFPAELLRRIDQALGHIDEPLVPIVAPPLYHSLHYLIEPIITADAIVARASRQMQTLTHVLVRDDVGARALRLSLYHLDGAVLTIDIALTLPTRSVAHVARMIALKLEASAAADDAGFGFEAIGLAVTRAEPMPARQTELTCVAEGEDKTEPCAALIDALRQRLGPSSVRRFEPIESHVPERAEALVPAAAGTAPDSRLRGNERTTTHGEVSQEIPRPLLLLPHAEPAEDVVALVPDGPPRRFGWRGMTYEIAGAQGPERIGAEWWRSPHGVSQPTRDYYLVEDVSGHRLWLFREGIYGRETAAARWFVHGLFA